MTDDRYEIRGKIGQGGVGAVYRAWDKRLNREVAIKRVLTDAHFENEEEAIAHLLKEATALSSVQHPHIVTIYDAGVDEDGPYVVMELLDGRTIDEMVERGTLVIEDFRQVAIQTQEALIAAQDLDLVHRDLKPTNIMVVWLPSGKFQIKIVDFGLAKFSARPSIQTIDHGDAVFGSIHFMAPEQFERTPLDQRTDMYAMGCLYYFTLTGSYPFSGEDAPQVMAAHLQHHVTPLPELRPDLPAWVCAWVMWHINRRMEDRPANAREALQKFLMSEQENTAPSEGEEPKPQRPKFVFPGTEEGAAIPAPATPPTGETEAQPASPKPPTSPVSKQTSPQPIQPPEGQKPSVHTTSQVTASQPTPPAPAPEAAPPPPPAAPATPAAPPATPAAPPATPAAPPAPPAAPPATPAAPPAPPAAPAVPVPPPPPAVPAAPILTPANPPAPVPATAVPPAGPPNQPLATTSLKPGPVQPTAPPVGVPQAAIAQPGAPQAAIAQPGALPEAARASAVITGASTLDAPRKGLSTAAKATIAAVLAVAVLFIGIMVMGRISDNRDAKRATELIAPAKDLNVRDAPTSSDDVDFLLEIATSLAANKDRQAVYRRLFIAAPSDGSDIDQQIAQFAASDDNPMIPDIRMKLFEVLKGRKSASSVPYLIEHAQNTANEQTAAAALQAVEKIATGKDLGDLVNIIRFTSHNSVRQAAKRTIAAVAKETDGREALATALKAAYDTAPNEEVKRAYLELLGSAGGSEAQDLIKSALEDEDKKTQLAAIAALRSWPDDSMFEDLIDYAKGQEDDLLRSQSFGGAYSFLKLERDRDEIDLEDMWKMLAREARTTVEKRQIIDGMANLTDDWAFSVVEFFEEDKDDEVSYRAEQARERMEERRERIEAKDDDE